MFAFIIRKISGMPNVSFFVQDGNIYITKGEAKNYPCVVAHMDTVHKIVEDLYVLQVGHKLTGFNRIKMEQTGIGGDDKVGIFIDWTDGYRADYLIKTKSLIIAESYLLKEDK